MEGYTYDAESIDLSADELAAYGEIVRAACVPEAQNRFSCFLALVARPQGASVIEFATREAKRMWRTELRV
jgi:predicted SpoU family rRNA methylase